MSSTDVFRTRYLDELRAASAVLESFEAGAQAEAWVSGAVAEWRALDGVDGDLAPAVAEASPLAAGLIEWFLGGGQPQGEAVWLADLGRCELANVRQLSDPAAHHERALIFEYSLDGEPDHDLSVSIVAGLLTGVSIGPAGLVDGVAEDDDGLAIELVGVDTATAWVVEAIEQPLDQLSPSSEANIPLLLRRFGGEIVVPSASSIDRTLPPRDPEDDEWCADVVSSALRSVLAEPAPSSVGHAVDAFAVLVADQDPDALTVLDIAGVGTTETIDQTVLLKAVGAYFAPVDLTPHTDAQFEALVELEPVDWVGVVLGLTRSKAEGPPLDGDALVTFINRAPEITSTIPKKDAPRIAWTFDQMLFAWEVTGVIDEAGRVSEAGRWLLAHSFVTAMKRPGS